MGCEYLKDPPAGIFEAVETDKTLDIAVIGAGIAGLAAAAGLLRSGHRVEAYLSVHNFDICLIESKIFERSKFSNEVGAAIHVCPNASRVLRYWGFDFEKANQVSFGQVR